MRFTKDSWATPAWLYKKLDEEFHFDFDPCPLNNSEGFDGLEVEWGKCNYVNPPYNRIDKPKFIRKAYEEWKKGKTIVMLLPVCTSTADFHNIILPNAEIRFFKGRLSFIGFTKKGITSDVGAQFDNMLVIFRGKKCTTKLQKK